MLVQSLALSRLDRCNSLLVGLLMQVIRALQLIQKSSSMAYLQSSKVHSCHSTAAFPPLASCSCPHKIYSHDACLQTQNSTSPSLPDDKGQNVELRVQLSLTHHPSRRMENKHQCCFLSWHPSGGTNFSRLSKLNNHPIVKHLIEHY